MERQEHFKSDKFNKITTFLTKFIFSENFDMLKKLGLVDSYISDPDIVELIKSSKDQKLLFLLFHNKKLSTSEIKKIITNIAKIPIEIVFSYELVNDYLMIVIDFPSEFYRDFDNIISGKYSKLSDVFKDQFPNTADVYNTNNQKIGKEYTIFHHIFNKTDWLKDVWLKKLNLMQLDDNLELWEIPNDKDKIFNKQDLIKS